MRQDGTHYGIHSPRNRFEVHLISDRKQTRGDLRQAILAALRGGIDCVQLREKGGPALHLFETAQALVPETRRAGARLLINDRVDVALAASADGVHLAGKSLPPEVARELLQPGMLLGVSVHGLEEARAAVAAGADYVTFGHVYPTSSKPGLPPRGIRQLASLVESLDVPVLAIGGIEPTNVREALATGAAGIAVISSVLAAPDPEAAARELRRAVDESGSQPRHPLAPLRERALEGGATDASHARDR